MSNYNIKDFYEAGYARYIGRGLWAHTSPDYKIGCIYKISGIENSNSHIYIKGLGFVSIDYFEPATKKDYDKQEIEEALR